MGLTGMLGNTISGHLWKDTGETYQEMGKHIIDARKGKGKGGNLLGGWANTENPPTTRADPVGEACGASNWALKTNEMSVVKQMPLLSEFPSYCEWGGEKQEDGLRHFIAIP